MAKKALEATVGEQEIEANIVSAVDSLDKSCLAREVCSVLCAFAKPTDLDHFTVWLGKHRLWMRHVAQGLPACFDVQFDVKKLHLQEFLQSLKKDEPHFIHLMQVIDNFMKAVGTLVAGKLNGCLLEGFRGCLPFVITMSTYQGYTCQQQWFQALSNSVPADNAAVDITEMKAVSLHASYVLPFLSKVGVAFTVSTNAEVVSGKGQEEQERSININPKYFVNAPLFLEVMIELKKGGKPSGRRRCLH